jgi:hypothetical protein
MEQKKQYTAFDLLRSIAGVVAILGVFYLGAQKWDLTFDTQEEKVRNKRHLENIGSESKVAIEKQRDSMFQEYVKQKLETDVKDMKRHIHHQDSIMAKLNQDMIKVIDQIYISNELKRNQ